MTQTIPFNFDDLYANAREILSDSGFDTSEGSNTSQLCAIMAYMVATLNLNTAFNINETLLPFATKRKNILQDARTLGYEPVHKLSYIYEAEITLSDALIGYNQLVIPKLSYLSANGHKYYLWDYSQDVVINLGAIKIDNVLMKPAFISYSYDELKPVDFSDIDQYGNDFYYFKDGTTRTNQLSKSELKSAWNVACNTFEKTFKLKLTEGEVYQYYSKDADGNEYENKALKRTLRAVQDGEDTVVYQYIDIPYTDIEEDGIQCFVSFYDNAGVLNNDVRFTRARDYFFDEDGATNTEGVTNETLNRTFLRLDDIEMNTPRVYFQYAGMGMGLPSDASINFNILVSSGTDGGNNGETGTIVNFDGSTIASSDNWLTDAFADSTCEMYLIRTGRQEESNASIKAHAPRLYNSAHRLITNVDFKYATSRHSSVRESIAWGGEEEFPRAPGHIWFSFIKDNSDDGFTNDDNEDLYIRNHTEIEDPYNFFLDYDTRREYYSNLYLTGETTYNDVLDSLSSMYVPSITFHHRHPLFLDFYYTFKLLKYDVRQDESEFHKVMFKVLDNCFRGNDLNLERFGVEYFHTNIVKRLDYAISDKCGFVSELETKVVLNEMTLCTENWLSQYKDIYVPLCVPFEKYFDNTGFLDIDRLPNIDTQHFLRYFFDAEVTEDNNTVTKTFDLLTGDLFTDWKYIKEDQEIRRKIMESEISTVDYTDTGTRLFMAPIKVKMRYMYKIKVNDLKRLKLGFKLAPDNTADSSYNNIQVLVFASSHSVYDPDKQAMVTKTYDAYDDAEDANYDLLRKIYCNTEIDSLNTYMKTSDSPFCSIISSVIEDHNNAIAHGDTPFTDNFYYTADEREVLKTYNSILGRNYIVEVRFERTCGYYYLFNGTEKKILIHLFVNGNYPGFEVAGNGMTLNDEYDVLPAEVAEAWKKAESELSDDTKYDDIMYSEPRSYLVSGDKKYMYTAESTGLAMETEPHYIAYNKDGSISSVSKAIRDKLSAGMTIDEIIEEHPEYITQLEALESATDSEVAYNLTIELNNGRELLEILTSDFDTYVRDLTDLINEDDSSTSVAIQAELVRGKLLTTILEEHPEYVDGVVDLIRRRNGILEDSRESESLEPDGSTNGHYLTTEGYLVDDDDDIDIYTGPKIREYNEAMYLYSPLTTDLFKQNVLLNVKYNSLNFKVRQNVIPRLRSVKFVNATTEY